MSAFIEQLNQMPLAGVMLVVTLGFLLGRLSWREMALGPAGGTLLVALALGTAGLSFSGLYGSEQPVLTLGGFGFALFIYSVGFEAGPRFFAAWRGGKALAFTTVGVLVNVLAVGLAVGAGRLLGLDPSVTAGLLAGALTSVPTYAAATAIAPDSAALAVSFVLTYPLGLMGVVVLVQFVPRLMGDDLSRGTRLFEEGDTGQVRSTELRRVYEVTAPEVIGRTLAELALTRRTGCTITRFHRGSTFRIPDADTCLLEGDHVMAKGRLDELKKLEAIVGPEVFDDELRSRLPSPRAIRVGAPAAVGKTLAELDLVRRHHCLVTEVVRARMALEPGAELALMRDDVALVVGQHDDVRAVARELGRFERSTQETDVAIYAGGIFVGLVVGRLILAPLGIDAAVGSAVGLLAMGVLLGRFQRIGPFSAHVPVAARQLVRDLGILLFVAETGIAAGASSLAGMPKLIAPALALGAAITLFTVLGSLAVARYLLRLRPVDAWGSICGGLTSSAALVTLRNAADSNEPAISYAASYAVASVLATLAGQVVLWMM